MVPWFCLFRRRRLFHVICLFFVVLLSISISTHSSHPAQFSCFFILFQCALSLTIIYICNAVSDLVTLLSILVLSLIYVFFYFSFISLLSTMSSSAWLFTILARLFLPLVFFCLVLSLVAAAKTKCDNSTYFFPHQLLSDPLIFLELHLVYLKRTKEYLVSMCVCVCCFCLTWVNL